jgi:aminopeptidase YwaD
MKTVRRRAASLLMVLVLAVLAPAAVVTRGAPEALAAPVAPAAPSGDAAFAHVQHLAGVIGPRVASTPAERQAAEYLAAQLRSYGYPVEFHNFQFPFFEARQVQVQVLGAAPHQVTAEALFFSSATPAGGREAEVVAVGLGRPEDYEGRRVSGAIVLAERGTITFREKAANAAARGAIAIIIYNNQPGIVSGTLQQRSEIPAVEISQEDGRQLVETGQRGGLRIHLLVDTVFETRSAANVVATKRGTTRPDEIIVVGGHYDSVPRGPGANDNASGVATILEAARVLAGIPTPRTVQFVLFSGEELGLFGSGAFASERRQGVVAMINLDMVGWGDHLMIGNSQGNSETAVNAAAQAAQRLGIQVTRFRSGGSDHVSFERFGIPTVFLHRGIDPDYHKPTDVPANVDPRHLEEAARLAIGLVQDLAQLRLSLRQTSRSS